MRRIRICGSEKEDGQSLIEFALIAPIIILFLFGLVDFGLFLNQRIGEQHAVREGARYAAVSPDCTAIQQRTSERAGGIVDPGNVRVRYFDDDGPVTSAAAGDTVEVIAPLPYNFSLISRFGIPGGSGCVKVAAKARLEMAVPDAAGCGPEEVCP